MQKKNVQFDKVMAIIHFTDTKAALLDKSSETSRQLENGFEEPNKSQVRLQIIRSGWSNFPANIKLLISKPDDVTEISDPHLV